MCFILQASNGCSLMVTMTRALAAGVRLPWNPLQFEPLIQVVGFSNRDIGLLKMVWSRKATSLRSVFVKT